MLEISTKFEDPVTVVQIVDKDYFHILYPKHNLLAYGVARRSPTDKYIMEVGYEVALERAKKNLKEKKATHMYLKFKVEKEISPEKPSMVECPAISEGLEFKSQSGANENDVVLG